MGSRLTVSPPPARGRLRRREASLLRACLAFLQASGYPAFRTNSGLLVLESGGNRRAVRLGKTGTPDIICCGPGGRFIAIECKSENGRLTPLQQDTLRRVQKAGGISLVVRNIDELAEALQKLSR